VSVGQASGSTSNKRRLDRRVVVGLVVAGLVLDYLGYMLVNMLSWLGGPFGLFAITAFTILIGAALWFIPVATSIAKGIVLVVAACLWMFGSITVFFWADTVQQRLWIEDTERVAKDYAKGALPPDCGVAGTYRGSLHTPIECSSEVAEVAAWYRSRLGSDWVESTEQLEAGLSSKQTVVVFTRTRPDHQREKIRIYRDIVFTGGTAVLVSPTQTNRG